MFKDTRSNARKDVHTVHGGSKDIGNDETEQLRHRRVLGLERVDGREHGGERRKTNAEEDRPERQHWQGRVVLRGNDLHRRHTKGQTFLPLDEEEKYTPPRRRPRHS